MTSVAQADWGNKKPRECGAFHVIGASGFYGLTIWVGWEPFATATTQVGSGEEGKGVF